VVILANGAQYVEDWTGDNNVAVVQKIVQSHGYGLSDVYRASVNNESIALPRF
jgi:hypothetical protein